MGRAFPTKDGRRFAEPLIPIADRKGHQLSFVNLIAERYKAGETMDELAKDYERDRADIEEAVRCELELHTQAA